MSEFDNLDNPDLSDGSKSASQPGPDPQAAPAQEPQGVGSDQPQYPGYNQQPGYDPQTGQPSGQPGYDPQTGQPYGQPGYDPQTGQPYGQPGYDPQTGQPYGQPPFQQTINIQSGPVPYYEPKSKIAAGVLGILLGGLGVHNFYLGYTGKAVAQLLITVLTCGFGGVISGVWGLIEGIMILTGSIAVDGRGVPLKE